MPAKHALLGPSSAFRWSPLHQERPPGGRAAGHRQRLRLWGALAHRLGELLLRAEYEGADIADGLAEVQADPQYSNAMREHMEGYAAFVGERMAEARTRCKDPLIFVEQRVDVTEYVPDGFGTADCVIIADGLMDVIDLKYGAGHAVSAEGNPQIEDLCAWLPAGI
ncbi:MAG: DUF2800 domain-containing protein [Evtepia sp.]